MRSDGNAGWSNAFRLRASAYRSLESRMKGNWTCYMLAGLLAVANVAGADAQNGPYPNKPVQIITDSSAGSTPDVALRFVADGLTQVWKQKDRKSTRLNSSHSS